ncbi:MAG: glycosyltransferase family 87 protein [Pseudonocardiaceae bacterium]
MPAASRTADVAVGETAAAPAAVVDNPAARRVLPAVLWPVAIATYLHTVSVALPVVDGVDFQIIYGGARDFLQGRPVYDDVGYLFFPGGVLLSAPMAVVGPEPSHFVFVLLGALCAPVAAAVALRMMGRSWRSPLGAGLLLGLAISESVTVTLVLGNVNTGLAALQVLALYLLVRRRNTTAGLMLGLAITLKPVVAPVLLVPLLARRWGTAVVAAVVAVAVNAVGFLLVAERDQFLSNTVPTLTSYRGGLSSSLIAAATFLDAPPGVALVARAVVVVLVAGVLVWSRAIPDEPVRYATQAGALLLGTFLAASLSEMYWSVLLLPLILTVCRPVSPMHTWPAWLAVYLFATLDIWAAPQWSPAVAEYYIQLRPTAGWALLLAVLVGWTWRQHRHAAAGGHQAGA